LVVWFVFTKVRDVSSLNCTENTASLLTFHFVQRWVYEFLIEQHRSIAIFTSVVNYTVSIALAVIVIGLTYTVKKNRSE